MMALDLTEVNALVGKESTLIAARHPANIPDIRHWCEVIREDNRSYTVFEREVVHAPAALLMTWAMPPLWSPVQRPSSHTSARSGCWRRRGMPRV